MSGRVPWRERINTVKGVRSLAENSKPWDLRCLAARSTLLARAALEAFTVWPLHTAQICSLMFLWNVVTPQGQALGPRCSPREWCGKRRFFASSALSTPTAHPCVFPWCPRDITHTPVATTQLSAQAGLPAIQPASQLWMWCHLCVPGGHPDLKLSRFQAEDQRTHWWMGVKCVWCLHSRFNSMYHKGIGSGCGNCNFTWFIGIKFLPHQIFYQSC